MASDCRRSYIIPPWCIENWGSYVPLSPWSLLVLDYKVEENQLSAAQLSNEPTLIEPPWRLEVDRQQCETYHDDAATED